MIVTLCIVDVQASVLRSSEQTFSRSPAVRRDACNMCRFCLWDLAGKRHDLPIYKLLGAACDRVRAYASTFMRPTPEAYEKG